MGMWCVRMHPNVKTVIIDRFEGRFAVVETAEGKMLNIPKELLPSEAKESDIVSIGIDKEATAERRSQIIKLANKLMEQ